MHYYTAKEHFIFLTPSSSYYCAHFYCSYANKYHFIILFRNVWRKNESAKWLRHFDEWWNVCRLNAKQSEQDIIESINLSYDQHQFPRPLSELAIAQAKEKQKKGMTIHLQLIPYNISNA